jgi:hypothetical protein
MIVGGRRARRLASGKWLTQHPIPDESLWPFSGDEWARGEVAGAHSSITGDWPARRPPTNPVPQLRIGEASPD